jgi:RHS repeat-associated protein
MFYKEFHPFRAMRTLSAPRAWRRAGSLRTLCGGWRPEPFDPSDGQAYSVAQVTRHIHAGLTPVVDYNVSSDGVGGHLNTRLREFVWGDRFPEPVALIDWTAAGDVESGTAEVLHYLHDALGSVVGLTNAAGALVERYTYDPYGQTYIEDPATQTFHGWSRFGNPWSWTGQRFDATTGLYHFLFRSYSPRLGRWLQRDPIGYVDGVSLYLLVGGNAVLWIDAFGLEYGDGDYGSGWGVFLVIWMQWPTDDEAVMDAQDEVAQLVNETTDDRQKLLDVVGYVPGAGALADATNAALDAVQGDVAGAITNALGAIPGGDGGKAGNKAMGAIDDASDLSKNIPTPKPKKPKKPKDGKSAKDYDQKAPGQNYEEVDAAKRAGEQGKGPFIESKEKSKQRDTRELLDDAKDHLAGTKGSTPPGGQGEAPQGDKPTTCP